MKKKLSLIAASVLAAGLMVGCGTDTETLGDSYNGKKNSSD